MAAVLQSFTTESMMKLHATISILSTMLLIGLHGATSLANCRDKTHMDTVNIGVLRHYIGWGAVILILGICGLVQLSVDYISVYIRGAWSLLSVQDKTMKN